MFIVHKDDQTHQPFEFRPFPGLHHRFKTIVAKNNKKIERLKD